MSRHEQHAFHVILIFHAGVPISDLCDELGLQPTVFYRWQKEFFENGAAAFQQRGRNHQPERRQRAA